MIQKNLTKILLVVLGVGVLVTAYNTFVNNDSENNASTRLANYLSIDRARQAVEGAEDVVVGTDNQPTETAPAAEEQTAAPEESAPAPETSPAPETAPAPETEAPEAAEEQPAETPEPAPSTPAPAGDKAESVYTVKEGDTYACIAERYYGSLEHYTDIMAANPIYDTGFAEYTLHVDAQLVLPAISASNLKPATTACQ